MLHFDLISKNIGQDGKAQILMLCLLICGNAFEGLTAISTVFIAYSPKFRCEVSPLDEYVKNESTILDITTSFDISKNEYNGCSRYGYDISNCNKTLECVDKKAPLIPCENGYHYDKSIFTKTATTQFNMVCGDSFFKTLSTSMYQLGCLIGLLFSATLADRYGRKIVFLVAYVGGLAFNFGASYSQTKASYIICRLFTGLFGLAASSVSYLHALELASIEKRALFSLIIDLSFPLGYMVFTLIAYLWRDWNNALFYSSIIASPIVILIVFLPESPRWLFSKNKDHQGKQVAMKIAKFNGIKLDEDLWKKAEIVESTSKSNSNITDDDSLLIFVKHPDSRKIMLSLLFCWFTVASAFFMISLNAEILPGNVFMNNIINGLMEIGSLIFIFFFTSFFGRRTLMASGQTLTGISLINSTIFSEFGFKTTSLVFMFLAKFFATLAYFEIGLLTAEILPTVARVRGCSFLTAVGRIGSFSSQFIVHFQLYKKWIPNSVFGVLILIASSTCLILPETKNCIMMESIEEAKYFYTHKKQMSIKTKGATNQAFESESNHVYENL